MLLSSLLQTDGAWQPESERQSERPEGLTGKLVAEGESVMLTLLLLDLWTAWMPHKETRPKMQPGRSIATLVELLYDGAA